MAIQLNFFEEKKTEVEYLKDEMLLIRQSSDKVRKSLFAKHSELAKLYLELHCRMDIIERNICKSERVL